MVVASYDAASGTLTSTFDASAGALGIAVYNGGDLAWIMVAAVLVMIMSPGLGFLYSGLLRRKNALSMLLLAMAVYCVATIEWFFWGYSLTFADDGSAYIGTLKHFGMIGVLDAPSVGSAKIPALLYAFYQSMFATITPVIAIAGAADRARLLPVLVVTFIWCTIVYNPVASWVWSPTGWLYTLGDLDFAGGGPVHITSGTAAVMWSIYLGKRRGYGTAKLAYRPHSVSHVVLGTVLLWFGWFGFNGGSELAMNLRSVQAGIVTNIAAAMGGLTWMALDFIHTGKISAVALCSGIIAGLVGITPAAGYVGSPAALCIGFVTAIACNYATGLKLLLKIDDAVDAGALHAIGGIVGGILTGFFADSRVAGFDGYTEIAGGWINKNYIQMGYQLAGMTAICAYTAVVTYIILFLVDHIPGLRLRCTEESEVLGLDETESGETSYDFVYIRPDLENADEHQQWQDKKEGALQQNSTPREKTHTVSVVHAAGSSASNSRENVNKTGATMV